MLLLLVSLLLLLLVAAVVVVVAEVEVVGEDYSLLSATFIFECAQVLHLSASRRIAHSPLAWHGAICAMCV